MWAAWVVAAIALAGAVFMLRFLMALLNEAAPSVCYWVVPVRSEPRIEEHPRGFRGVCVDDDDVELLEHENYAKEKCSSSLIVLDVRSVSEGWVWRTIHPRRSSAFREY